MAPVGSAAVFLALGLPALLPGLVLRGIPQAWYAGFFAMLAVLTVLLPFGEIARWAVLLLGVGIGARVAQDAGRHPARWGAGLRRLGARVLIGVLLLGLGQQATLAVIRQRQLASLASAPPGAPSLLLIILDTVRGFDLSLYGYPLPTTPALQKWAARGVVFEHAFATSSWTLPSHAALFTGRVGGEESGGWTKPVEDSLLTLAEVLRSRGYHTGGFTANLGYTSPASGLAQGFVDYRTYPFSLRQILLHAPLAQLRLTHALLAARSRYELKQAILAFDLTTHHLPGRDFVPGSEVSDAFLEWHAGVAGRPFFAFLNYFDAHEPYRAPPAFEARFVREGTREERYHAAIAYLDSELDRVLSLLERRGALRNTVVAITSDHGELLGRRRGQTGHAASLHLPVLWVPLVLIYPKELPPGLEVEQPVSLRDVPATLLDLADIPADLLRGESLAGLWDSTAREPASPVVSELIQGPDPEATTPNATTWLASLLDTSYHYIRNGRGEEELYAWRVDSLELRNLIHTPDGKRIAARLRQRLAQARRAEP